MKKEFLTPAISICTFSAEDIITDSAQTAKDIVKSELDADTVITASWGQMNSVQE